MSFKLKNIIFFLEESIRLYSKKSHRNEKTYSESAWLFIKENKIILHSRAILLKGTNCYPKKHHYPKTLPLTLQVLT